MKEKKQRGRPKVDNPLVTFAARVDATALSTCRERYGKTLNQKVNLFIKRLAKR